MAQKRKRSDARRREKNLKPQSDLARAVLGALERLIAIEGDRAAVARSLNLTSRVLGRWLSEGLPASIVSDERKLRELVAVVYARLADWDDPKKREQRERRLIRSSRFTSFLTNPKERGGFARRIRAWVSRMARISKLFSDKESGAELFAGELGSGVTTEMVRSAVKGRVLPTLYDRFKNFEDELARQELEDEEDKDTMLELIAEAESPAVRIIYGYRKDATTGRRVRVPIERAEVTVPTMTTGSGQWGGDKTSGYRWRLSVKEFLRPRLDAEGRDGYGVAERMVSFVRRIKPLDERRFPRWFICAMVSILDRGGAVAKSDKVENIRELEADDDDKFIVSSPIPSELFWGPGARERAIEAFLKKVRDKIENENLTYVHGVYAWQSRQRPDVEAIARVEIRDLRRKQAENRKKRLEGERAKRAKRTRRREKVVQIMSRRRKRPGE